MLQTILASVALSHPQAMDFSITIDVLVLNYDPIMEGRSGMRLHEAMGWSDPRTLAQGYAADIAEVSGGFINLNLKEWRDLDEWPKKIDGFRYTDRTYFDVIYGRTAAHQPDESDYPLMLRRQGVSTAMDSGKFDELWVFSFPYAGHWEAAMAGPEAFFINGGVYDSVPCKTRFAIMGFSFERQIGEMLHNTSHRAENHMARVFGRWQPGTPTNAWERFSAYESTSPGYASVGNCHFPPNGESDYDYSNPRTVMSSADDWFDYPKLDGQKATVNCETWGGPDYQRNYLKWWFNHFPRNKGKDGTGRQNNWWKYIYRFNNYDEYGR